MTADELIMKIGTMILNDERYEDDWSALSLVGDLANGGKGMHGYVYFSDGRFEGRIPAVGRPLIKLFIALRDEMDRTKGVSWHQCLVQITRPDLDIRIQFEYDDPRRWSVTPANLSAQVEAMRP